MNQFIYTSVSILPTVVIEWRDCIKKVVRVGLSVFLADKKILEDGLE